MSRSLFCGLLLAGSLTAVATRAQDDVESPADEVAPPPPPIEEDAQQPPQGNQDPAALAPPAQEPTQETFDESLSPYGRWVDTPDYGRVWVPANVSADWQPYTDGQWVDTAYGWSFYSSVPWGWACFHYGRWGFRPGMGWYWVPGYRWAPAWVAWRHANGFAAWSPLAPRGYVYGQRWPGWVAMPHQHFNQPIRRWRVPPQRVGVIVRSARPVRGFGSIRYRPIQQPVRRGVVAPQQHHTTPGRRH